MKKIPDPYLKPTVNFERLLKEYHQYNGLVVAYDFDGTVYDYHNAGESYDAVIGLLRDLKDIGCELICFTAREEDHFVREYLEDNQIPFDRINENPGFFSCSARKIYYNAYLDDRAGLIQVFSELSMLVTRIKDSSK